MTLSLATRPLGIRHLLMFLGYSIIPKLLIVCTLDCVVVVCAFINILASAICVSYACDFVLALCEYSAVQYPAESVPATGRSLAGNSGKEY